MTVDLRNDPDWRRKAPYGMHVDGTPLTKEDYEALHGQKTLHVSVDTTTVEKLAKEREIVQEKEKELDEKLAKAEVGEEMFEDVRSKLQTEYEGQGLPVPKVENAEDLNNAVEILKKLKAKQSSGGFAQGGSAPLSGQTSSHENEGYSSYEAMILDLREKASRNDPIAQEQLRKLLYKTLKSVRDNKMVLPSYQPEPVQTTTTDLIEGGGKISVKSDILGIQKRFRKAKLMALAERGNQEAINILNSGDY